VPRTPSPWQPLSRCMRLWSSCPRSSSWWCFQREPPSTPAPSTSLLTSPAFSRSTSTKMAGLSPSTPTGSAPGVASTSSATRMTPRLPTSFPPSRSPCQWLASPPRRTPPNLVTRSPLLPPSLVTQSLLLPSLDILVILLRLATLLPRRLVIRLVLGTHRLPSPVFRVLLPRRDIQVLLRLDIQVLPSLDILPPRARLPLPTLRSSSQPTPREPRFAPGATRPRLPRLPSVATVETSSNCVVLRV